MLEQEQKLAAPNDREIYTCDSVGTAVSTLVSVNYEVSAISDVVNSVSPTRTVIYIYIYRVFQKELYNFESL